MATKGSEAGPKGPAVKSRPGKTKAAKTASTKTKAAPEGAAASSERRMADPQVMDNDDPALLAERRWSSVIREWMVGNTAPAVATIRDAASPLTDEAREFLADVLAGKAKRLRGRPVERSGRDERSIVIEVFSEWERRKAAGTPHPREQAIASVAVSTALTEDAIRGVVTRLRRAGWTLDSWIAWGRPRQF